jgi:hypothetical protein
MKNLLFIFSRFTEKMQRCVMEKQAYPTDNGNQIHHHKDKYSAIIWQETVRLIVTKKGEVGFNLYFFL